MTGVDHDAYDLQAELVDKTRAQECRINAAGAHLEQVVPRLRLQLLNGADDVGSQEGGVPLTSLSVREATYLGIVLSRSM